jgi:hypothetical protein
MADVSTDATELLGGDPAAVVTASPPQRLDRYLTMGRDQVDTPGDRYRLRDRHEVVCLKLGQGTRYARAPLSPGCRHALSVRPFANSVNTGAGYVTSTMG